MKLKPLIWRKEGKSFSYCDTPVGTYEIFSTLWDKRLVPVVQLSRYDKTMGFFPSRMAAFRAVETDIRERLKDLVE